MSLRLAGTVKRRSMSLTPMIDVVFLLLVFFMLASQFETTGGIEFPVIGSEAKDDTPRLVDVFGDTLSVNGVVMDEADLAARVQGLMEGAASVVVLRPREGASVQRLVDVAEALRKAGITNLAIVE